MWPGLASHKVSVVCRVWSNIQDSGFARSTGCLIMHLLLFRRTRTVPWPVLHYMHQVRFAYENTALAGFAEMTPEWSYGLPTDVIRKFRQALLAVDGITLVQLHPKGTKAEQKNIGDHYQDQNFAVYTYKTGTHWMEFELTRKDHMTGADNFTVTACFKLPKREYVPEAWRVLTEVCLPSALLPDVVVKNHRKALMEVGVDLPEERNTSQPATSTAVGFPTVCATAASKRIALDPSSASSSTDGTGAGFATSSGPTAESSISMAPPAKRASCVEPATLPPAKAVPPMPAQPPPMGQDLPVPPTVQATKTVTFRSEDEIQLLLAIAESSAEGASASCAASDTQPHEEAAAPPVEEPDTPQRPLDEIEFSEDVADSSKLNVEEFKAVPNVEAATFAVSTVPVFGSPSERLGLEKLATKQDMFPEHMRPEHLQKHLGLSEAHWAMQQEKERGLEHVRYRSVDATGMDVQLEGSVLQIRQLLQKEVRRPENQVGTNLNRVYDLFPNVLVGVARSSNHVLKAEDFLKSGARKSLLVTKFKDQSPAGDLPRQEYAKLVDRLPQCAYEKFVTLETPQEFSDGRGEHKFCYS